MSKSAPATEFGETLVFGPYRWERPVPSLAPSRQSGWRPLGHLIFVSVWVDRQAHDETAVRDAAQVAVTHALAEAIDGRDAMEVAEPLVSRGSITHPFYRCR